MNICFVLICKPTSLPKLRRSLCGIRPQSHSSPRCVLSSTSGQEGATKKISRRDAIRFLAALGAGALPSISNSPTTAAVTRETDFLYDVKSGSFVPPSAMDALLRRDAGARFDRCIVAGEIHDNNLTHTAQLAVIDSARRMSDGKKLTVGFEQFYRTHNHLLDAYIHGNISMDALLRKTDWENTWGFESSLYTPIFEYCRWHGIPMRGLNIPRQFVSFVTQLGLEGLPQELKAFLPDEMDFGNREHYKHFVRLMAEGHEAITHNAILERYYEVQVLWEEWMSQSVALYLKEKPDARMVALIGSGHVEGRYGFPDRIEKRCNERPYTIVPRPVAWTYDNGCYMPKISGPERNVADLVWYTRRKVDLV